MEKADVHMDWGNGIPCLGDWQIVEVATATVTTGPGTGAVVGYGQVELEQCEACGIRAVPCPICNEWYDAEVVPDACATCAVNLDLDWWSDGHDVAAEMLVWAGEQHDLRMWDGPLADAVDAAAVEDHDTLLTWLDAMDVTRAERLAKMACNAHPEWLHYPEVSSYVQGGPPDDPLRFDRLNVVLVGTEWRSSKGGISTVNRELASALATIHNTYAIVPKADRTEVEEAAAHDVTLLHWDDHVPVVGDGLVYLAGRHPDLPRRVDLVIGHGRVTGEQAIGLARSVDAKYVHVLHMDPIELSSYKDAIDATHDAAARDRTERALARASDYVFAIGRYLAANLGARYGVQVHALIPGVPDTAPRPRPRGGRPVILLLGRLEDATIKGVDVIVRALAGIDRPRETRPHLLLVGVPDVERAVLHARIVGEWDGRGLDVEMHPFTDDPEVLQDHFGRASAVVVPSAVEGFGLVAFEAIGEGIPVLVSDESGAGMLLADLAPEIRLPVRELDGVNPATVWRDAIDGLLDDLDGADRRAADLRARAQRRYRWRGCATNISWVVGPFGATPPTGRGS
ncbi:glycosyltransferase family 4 protein [Euzebya pacifica]|uniref:glycosyltransferase family 4 protein n=1 Tax=Euzebya pacifica TaxID=1608957 RepID=UPI0030FCF520